jgi:hypothetical protein
LRRTIVYYNIYNKEYVRNQIEESAPKVCSGTEGISAEERKWRSAEDARGGIYSNT